jgi:hypothetical protein
MHLKKRKKGVIEREFIAKKEEKSDSVCIAELHYLWMLNSVPSAAKSRRKRSASA